MTWNQEPKTHTLLRQSLSALETQIASQQAEIDRIKSRQTEEIEVSRHLHKQCLTLLETHSKALVNLEARSTNWNSTLGALTAQLAAYFQRRK